MGRRLELEVGTDVLLLETGDALLLEIFQFASTLPATIGLSSTLTAQKDLFRTHEAAIGLQASLASVALDRSGWLCIASRDGGSIRTESPSGAGEWPACAKDADNGLGGAYFAQYLNRLCVIEYLNKGFSYSEPNDIVSNWTNKPDFPNLYQRFTDLFVARDAGDDPVLNFLTPIGMYYLDVFSNFVFGPTELMWEEDEHSGKKGLYWKGEHYIAVGKGIYKVSRGVVDLVGPDMDDGVPENLQGVITDMIGVGFWLVIAIDGGASKKSCIMKRYISGKHWHPVYVGSLDTPIRALCWDSGTLYFGEGTDVKSLPFPNVTDNVKQLTDHEYCETGEIIYPYFHSPFEAMPKVAHKVWATTQDCTSGVNILIAYRIDEETDWTELGMFESSPRPDALQFPVSGDSIGLAFERIQFKAVFARGDTKTNSPKLESLILEYRVTPPVLWGWDVQVLATTTKERRGQDIIDELIAAIRIPTLLSFYPSGSKEGTEYFVEVRGMPGTKKGTEFGQEGVYTLSVQEVIEQEVID